MVAVASRATRREPHREISPRAHGRKQAREQQPLPPALQVPLFSKADGTDERLHSRPVDPQPYRRAAAEFGSDVYVPARRRVIVAVIDESAEQEGGGSSHPRAPKFKAPAPSAPQLFSRYLPTEPAPLKVARSQHTVPGDGDDYPSGEPSRRGDDAAAAHSPEGTPRPSSRLAVTPREVPLDPPESAPVHIPRVLAERLASLPSGPQRTAAFSDRIVAVLSELAASRPPAARSKRRAAAAMAGVRPSRRLAQHELLLAGRRRRANEATLRREAVEAMWASEDGCEARGTGSACGEPSSNEFSKELGIASKATRRTARAARCGDAATTAAPLEHGVTLDVTSGRQMEIDDAAPSAMPEMAGACVGGEGSMAMGGGAGAATAPAATSIVSPVEPQAGAPARPIRSSRRQAQQVLVDEDSPRYRKRLLASQLASMRL